MQDHFRQPERDEESAAIGESGGEDREWKMENGRKAFLVESGVPEKCDGFFYEVVIGVTLRVDTG